MVVTVFAFNDICGLFHDNLCIDITGLDLFRFPVTVDIKGSPIIISENQLGIKYGNQNNDDNIPLFDLGTYMRNSGTVTREFKVKNSGPQDVYLEWKIFNLGD